MPLSSLLHQRHLLPYRRGGALHRHNRRVLCGVCPVRWLLAVALLYPVLAWGQIGGGVTTVTDLTTTVANALKITVSGGTVTNLGGGNAEISLSGGGVGCTPAGGNATTNLITYGTGGACAVDIFANV